MEDSDPKKLLQKLSFVVIDLETTGGNHRRDKIIEVGLIKIEQLKIVDELHYLIDPEIEIPPFIQRLTSISPKKLARAPKIQDVIQEVLDFIGSSIIVAHNVSFDLPFLNSVLERLNIPHLNNPALCTNLMSQYLIPNILNSNLKYMSRLFNIPHNKAHRALEDAKASALLLLKLLEGFQNKGIRKVNQLYYPGSKFKLDRISFTREQKEIFLSTIDKIKTSAIVHFKGKKGLQLAILPLTSPSEEREALHAVMEKVDYETVSIELLGSLFEGILRYNAHYNKIKAPINEYIIDYLTQRYLKGVPLKFDPQRYRRGIDSKNFLITRHLIPDQFLIYPLFNLHSYQALSFRYPDHQKRCLHYATGHLKKAIRSTKNKKKRTPSTIHQDLFPFVEQYLLKAQREQSSDYLLIDKAILKRDPTQFGKLIGKFSRGKVQKRIILGSTSKPR